MERQGKYVRTKRCVKCMSKLTQEEIVYSSGVCPYCGHESKGNILKYKKGVEFIPSNHKQDIYVEDRVEENTMKFVKIFTILAMIATIIFYAFLICGYDLEN